MTDDEDILVFDDEGTVIPRRRFLQGTAAAAVTAPLAVERLADGEDARMLAQAAEHVVAHAKQSGWECEDMDNLAHFAAKVLAAPDPAPLDVERLRVFGRSANEVAHAIAYHDLHHPHAKEPQP